MKAAVVALAACLVLPAAGCGSHAAPASAPPPVAPAAATAGAVSAGPEEPEVKHGVVKAIARLPPPSTRSIVAGAGAFAALALATAFGLGRLSRR